jgi:hypothetical protein
MDWWNKQVIVQEKAIQEEDIEQDERVGNHSEFLVAVPNLPITEALLTSSAQKVVSNQSEFLLNPKPNRDSWNVAQANVHEDVIPPALSEVWENVLP